MDQVSSEEKEVENNSFLQTEIQDFQEGVDDFGALHMDVDEIPDEGITYQIIMPDEEDPQRAYKSLPEGFVIRPSWIPEEDQGVWTTVDIPKGTRFGPFEGDIVLDLTQIKNSRYCWEIYMNDKVSHFIDASDESRSNWMRFINFARNKEQQNVASHQEGGYIYYTTTRDITADTELLVWYKDSDIYASGGVQSQKEHDQEEIQEDQKFDDQNLDIKEDKPDKITQKDKLCEICGKVFKLKGTLNLHKKIHFGVKPHKCTECDKTFTQKCNLERHMFVHTKDGESLKHKCAVCNKVFHRSDNMLLHQRRHDKLSYICSVCHKKYERPGHIRRHLLEKHLQHESIADISGLGSYYSCEICNKTYSLKRSFIAHKKKHIENGLKDGIDLSEAMMGTLVQPTAQSKMEIGENDTIYEFEIPLIDDKFIQDLLLDRPMDGSSVPEIGNQTIKNGTAEQTVMNTVSAPATVENETEKPSKPKKKRRKKDMEKSSEKKEKKRRRKRSKKDAAAALWIGCSVCGRVFTDTNMLVQHAKTHTTRAAVCFRCGDH